jgi:hypothetical protein
MNKIIIALIVALAFNTALASGPKGDPPSGGLSEGEETTLVYMREEEKMARDVYLELHDYWDAPLFDSIAFSEQRHMDSLKTRIEFHGIEDPVKDDSVGSFTDDDIRDMFDKFVAQGEQALYLYDAYKVGAEIEEVDILDLMDAIEETDNIPLGQIYSNLLTGARNHFRAFVEQIYLLGEEYDPQLMSDDLYREIAEDCWGPQGPGPGPGQDPEPGTEPGPGMNINAGLTDAWYDPDTDGQGFFIAVYPNKQVIFLSWFTYDTERPDEGVTANLGDPGHRWMTAQGPYSGPIAELEVTQTSGGVFNDEVAEAARQPGGSILLQFQDCNTATVTFDLLLNDGSTMADVIPIQRIATDNVGRCGN